MIRLLLFGLLLTSSAAHALDQLPDVDVSKPPPKAVTEQPPSQEDGWHRNKRLAAEFGFAEALTLTPIAIGLMGCELTRDFIGRCSIVWPLIATVAAFVGPPAGILLGASLFGAPIRPGSAIVGTFLGLAVMLFPAVLLLELPAFQREPARSVMLGSLMSVFPVAGGMLSYELLLEGPLNAAIRVRASPTGLAATFP